MWAILAMARVRDGRGDAAGAAEGWFPPEV
jgi:hypothetical protein